MEKLEGTDIEITPEEGLNLGTGVIFFYFYLRDYPETMVPCCYNTKKKAFAIRDPNDIRQILVVCEEDLDVLCRIAQDSLGNLVTSGL